MIPCCEFNPISGTIAPPPPVADVMNGERKEVATVGCCEASKKLSVMVVKSGSWWLAIPGRWLRFPEMVVVGMQIHPPTSKHSSVDSLSTRQSHFRRLAKLLLHQRCSISTDHTSCCFHHRSLHQRVVLSSVACTAGVKFVVYAASSCSSKIVLRERRRFQRSSLYCLSKHWCDQAWWRDDVLIFQFLF